MYKIILPFLLVCISCVPPMAQKPSTTLLEPTETDLRLCYEENVDGILCLADFLSPQRYLLGINFKPADEGIEIIKIFESSPAEASGLKIGDIITKVNGQPVKEMEPFRCEGPSDLEIKRNNDMLTLRIVPALMKANNARETKLSIVEFKDEKYVFATIITGVELNTVQFKTYYERSKWIISNWATFFWKIILDCEKKGNIENIAFSFEYSHKNFVTDQYLRGHDESLKIWSKRADIVSYSKGDISVQELLDKSMIFINGSREKLMMQ